MKRASFARWPCSIARTVNILGDAWSPLVVREVFYGIHRFDDLHDALGIARTTLTERLRLLVEEGLLEKRPYQTEPVRHDYLLTAKGADFFSVLAAMSAWGDRWLAEEDGPPIVFRHETCGHDTQAVVVCEHCREPLRAADTRATMGPGYPRRLAERPDVRRRFALDRADGTA